MPINAFRKKREIINALILMSRQPVLCSWIKTVKHLKQNFYFVHTPIRLLLCHHNSAIIVGFMGCDNLRKSCINRACLWRPRDDSNCKENSSSRHFECAINREVISGVVMNSPEIESRLNLTQRCLLFRFCFQISTAVSLSA